MAGSFLLASEAWGLARMYRDSGRQGDALPLFHFALEQWKLESTEFQPIGWPQVPQSAWSAVSARY
jgi:hypothetical protein